MADPLLAKLLRTNGKQLVDRAVNGAVDKVVLKTPAGAPAEGQARISLPRRLAGAALLRVATGSVPGALVVGGALLAKHLYDRKKAREQAGPPATAPSPDGKTTA
jgi:hypothetical protein